MNALRIARLLRELADALEETEPPRGRRRKADDEPRPVDELAKKRAEQVLERKGLR